MCSDALSKIDKGVNDNRFGPSSKEEVLPFVSKHIMPGTQIFSDGLRAYRDNLVKMGYPGSEYVSHKDGEFVRTCTDGEKCHTNSIDGLWGLLKADLRYRLKLQSWECMSLPGRGTMLGLLDGTVLRHSWTYVVLDLMCLLTFCALK